MAGQPGRPLSFVFSISLAVVSFSLEYSASSLYHIEYSLPRTTMYVFLLKANTLNWDWQTDGRIDKKTTEKSFIFVSLLIPATKKKTE